MLEPPSWAGSWLLAYLVHSTVWLGGAWLLLKLRAQAAPRAREVVWRGALLGSLLTPTLALTLFAVEAAPPTIAEQPLQAQAPGPAALSDVVMLEPVDWAPPSAGPTEPAGWAGAPVVVDEVPAAAGPVPPAASVEGGGHFLSTLQSWLPAVGRALAWLWAPIALLALAAMALAQWRLWRLLRGRRDLEHGPLARRLRRLCGALPPGRSVRLTVSARLAVPVAFGLRRAEICLPARAVDGLDAEQQASMLGHELHHLLRRDPLVLALVQCCARLLWLQPLNFLALRELRLSAEECCDAWAAGRTGDPVAMAACLGEVAGWLVPPRPPLPAACMARPGSPLTRRIERLLDAGRAEELMPPLSRGQRMGAVGGFAVGVLLLPTLLPATRPAEAELSTAEAGGLESIEDFALAADFPGAAGFTGAADFTGLELAAEAPTLAVQLLAGQLDMLQQDLVQLREEVQQRKGADGADAALRLAHLHGRLARVQQRLQEALAGLPDDEDTLADQRTR